MYLTEAQWDNVLQRLTYLEKKVKELDDRTFKLVRLGAKYY